jgi:ribosomal protein L11 methyltransferase
MQPNDVWIKIEPKMAFGTGHHETTRLAAQEILTRKKWLAGKSALDIGTGSGVLCFIADHCGTTQSIGVEIDPCCRENLAENYQQNAPQGIIDFLIGTLACIKDTKAFDMVVMNMIMTESEPLLARVTELLSSGGILVWSGILAYEKESTILSAQKYNLKLAHEKVENEWWCGLFEKP